jgi:phospholipid/cholesterol/gamma-HCH transport system substrate-binding protein
MPRTRSLAWSELKIGVLTILAIAIGAVTVFMLTGDRGFSWQRYSLKARFASVPGLNAGSPVRLAGVEVGQVDEVTLEGEQVDVIFQVNERFRDRITTGSTARLGSVSLLGEAAVDITPSASGTSIPEWGYVPQGAPVAQLSDITDRAGQGIDELTGLIHDVRRGRGTVGKLMTDEQLYVEMQRFAASAGSLTDTIRQGRGTLGRLINDPATANALEASMKNVETLTRQLNAGEGSLGQLRLNDGEGTAGQLLKDRQLYENMNRVMKDASALLAEMTKNPRKYLNVKVSLF